MNIYLSKQRLSLPQETDQISARDSLRILTRALAVRRLQEFDTWKNDRSRITGSTVDRWKALFILELMARLLAFQTILTFQNMKVRITWKFEPRYDEELHVTGAPPHCNLLPVTPIGYTDLQYQPAPQ
ncbi:hypothetical protein ABKN59_005179 [Abortiporus biennis]